MKKLQIFLIGFFSLLLIGCLEYEETLTISSDGSGTLIFKMGVEESILEMSDDNDFQNFDENPIRQNFEGVDGIEVTESKSYTDKGVRWIEITLHFESLEQLSNAEENFDQRGFIGHLSFSKDADGNQVFTREISFQTPEEEQDEFSKNMMESVFGKYYWTYTTIFPRRVISANTSEKNINYEQNKVTWSFSLGSLFNEPQVMEATIAPPSQSNLWYIILGIVVIAGVVIFFLQKSRPK